MLTNTFCHIPGFGIQTERYLWTLGIHRWDAALDIGEEKLTPRARALLKEHIPLSMEMLEKSDIGYFAQALPSDQHWRLFTEFRNSIAYVDIETTGLGSPNDSITSITLYDGKEIQTFVQDENLREFPSAIKQYKLLVTYNGKCFDVPFIENYLGIQLSMEHIDLRFLLRSLGYRGGLKSCERQLGIERTDVKDVDGFFAVLLWNDYQVRGSARSLETLLAYNIIDTVNLETLLVKAYNLKLKETPFFAEYRLPMPVVPDIPYKADHETIERIRHEYHWRFGE
jgi:uncharacterized protein